MALNNVNIWNNLREYFPSFRSHTAKATADMFTEQGWEALKASDIQAYNEFFELSLRVVLTTVNVSHAKDAMEIAGFGESFDQPFGAIIQKMATYSIKPISQSYKGLTDGASPDPFVVRKPVVSERFFKQNFDYASLVTIPDDFQKKQIFISEFGMSEFQAGIFEGLQNGYTIQKFENKLEAINKAINSTAYPLKDTQKIEVSVSDTPTNAEVLELLLGIMNVIDAMQLPPQTDAFNAMSYASTQDPSRLSLLIRPGWKNRIFLALPQVFHYEKSPLANLNILEVPNFGGLEHYSDESYSTILYPLYDSLGAEIGWTLTAPTGVAATDLAREAYTGKVYVKDPNESTIGLLADKGFVFEARQNPYTVEPIRNPRGLYTNYWASSPNNTVAVDPIYNCVVINKSSV